MVAPWLLLLVALIALGLGASRYSDLDQQFEATKSEIVELKKALAAKTSEADQERERRAASEDREHDAWIVQGATQRRLEKALAGDQ